MVQQGKLENIMLAIDSSNPLRITVLNQVPKALELLRQEPAGSRLFASFQDCGLVFGKPGGGGVSAAETGGCRNPCGFVCTGTQQPGVPVLPSDRGNGTEEPKHRNVRKHDRIRRERNVRLNPVFEKEMKPLIEKFDGASYVFGGGEL